jgi:hypothetical protein
VLRFRVSAAVRALKFTLVMSALIIARATIWVARATLHSSDYLGHSSDIALEYLCPFQVLDSPKMLPC